MSVQPCTALLADRRKLSDKFLHLFFEMKEPSVLEFEAGQYVSLGFADIPARRPYSIASSPTIQHGFELLVDTTPQGIGTKYLGELQLGGEVALLAPMGMFTLAKGEQAEKEKSLMFIATGSGIAPLRSMILSLLQGQQDKREIWLYWGLRHIEDIFWEEEFQELEEAFPNFHFHLTVSQAVDDWPLCRGRVTDCLRIHDLPAEAGFYLCGNKPMIEDVMQLLTQDKGILPDFIHHEKFY